MVGIHLPHTSKGEPATAEVQCARNGSDANLRRLGERLAQQTDEVVSRMTALSRAKGLALDPVVEERLERVGVVSTLAVSRWMAGDDPQVAREIGQEAWLIFGELAAQRAASSTELTKRCMRWWNAAEEVVGDLALELHTPTEVCAQALAMLQRSVSVTLVRMCEACEAERARTDEERVRYEKKLEFKATHDELTKLPNRALILDRLEQMLVRARHSGQPVAAFFIDLDDFKSVNDTFGHDAGDALLRDVAARLRNVVRDVDALGRLGGDEFVLVTTGASLSSGAEGLARRLLASLKEPFRVGQAETHVTVTASIGVEVGQEECSAAELLKDADVAMYRAKWAGGNRYFMFRHELRPERRVACGGWRERLARLLTKSSGDMRRQIADHR